MLNLNFTQKFQNCCGEKIILWEYQTLHTHLELITSVLTLMTQYLKFSRGRVGLQNNLRIN